MSSIRGRIAALERQLGIRGGRRLCRCQDAKANVVVRWPGKPEPKAEERACDTCGGIQVPLLVHVQYEKREP